MLPVDPSDPAAIRIDVEEQRRIYRRAAVRRTVFGYGTFFAIIAGGLWAGWWATHRHVRPTYVEVTAVIHRQPANPGVVSSICDTTGRCRPDTAIGPVRP